MAEIEDLFHAALELDPDARRALLDGRCQGKPDLRRQVELMLAEHQAGTRGVLARDPAPPDLSSPPARIGPFRIISLLGTGGMGEVFEAEQTSLQRRVALKLLKTLVPSSELLRRFQREALVLADLKHPGIAQIFETGTAEDDAGRRHAYIAMELVRGTTLIDHAAKQHLSTNQRLELLARVADAIQHAHQRGVIHRDLKPLNILVELTPGDPIGQPKVLDFGIAALQGDSRLAETRATMQGAVLGTIAYMSPEQIENSALVDTRSDVYALGVIGYELLAGRPPLDLTKTTFIQSVRLLQESEPIPLGKVARECRGDIEIVIGKALAKDRNRRYPSVGDFGEDLRRILRHEAITARPPSRLYQIRKFARRNRPLVAATAVVALALVGATVAALVAEHKTRIERDRALAAQAAEKIQHTRSEQVSKLLTQTLGSIDPAIAQGRDTTLLKSVLDAVAARVDTDLPEAPEVRAELHAMLSHTYWSLGLLPPALANAEKSVAEYRLVNSASLSADTAHLSAELINLGRLHEASDKLDLAEAAFTESLKLRTAIAPESTEMSECLVLFADLAKARGQLNKALDFATRAAAMAEKTAGKESIPYGDALVITSVIEFDLGHYDKAIDLCRQTTAISRKLRGPDHPETLSRLSNLASALVAFNHLAEAEPLVRELMERRLRIFGPDHLLTAESKGRLAILLYNKGDPAAAADLWQQQVTAEEKLLGPTAVERTDAIQNLATALQDLHRQPEAEALYRTAARLLEQQLGPDHPRTATAQVNLAVLLTDENKHLEAITLFDHAIATFDKTLPPGHPSTESACVRQSTATLEAAWNLFQSNDHAAAAQMTTKANAIAARVVALRDTRPDCPQWQRETAHARLGAAQVMSGLIASGLANTQASSGAVEDFKKAESLLLPANTNLENLKSQIPTKVQSLNLRIAPTWLARMYSRWREIEPARNTDATNWKRQLESITDPPPPPPSKK